MRPKLIFITGAPGIGKTTVARGLFDRLSGCVWLDGDDVWRMNPFTVNDSTKSMVDSNIRCVLRNFLTTGFPYVILSWVMHRQDIIDKILKGLEGLEYELFVFTLVCDDVTLRTRLESDQFRRHVGELPFVRLRESRALGTTMVDTARMQPNEVVDVLFHRIGCAERT